MASEKQKTSHTPKLPKKLSIETLDHLENHGEYAALEITGSDLTDQAASTVLFEEALLHRTILTGSRLPKLRLLDVRLKACDLSGAFLEEARFRRVEFIDCRLLGVQMLSSQLDDVVFKDCNLEGAVFASSQTKGLHFKNCNLRNVSFEEAKIGGTIFWKCDLTNADLRNTTLQKADFRGSIINEMQVSAKDMQRAIISPTQAIQVVSLLGVDVLDEEV